MASAPLSEPAAQAHRHRRAASRRAGTPGNGNPGQPTCFDQETPRATLDDARVSHRRVNVFGSARDTGCFTDGRVARVQVAIAQEVRGRCRYLKRNGRLSARKRCAKPHFLTAKIGYSPRIRASRFRLKRTRLKLPPGRYLVTVKASDAARNARSTRRRVRVR